MMKQPDLKIQSYEEFWPFYVREHSDRRNRQLHFVGTILALVFITLAAIRLQPIFLLVALVLGYGFAWLGHFFAEHNHPATFKYPFYSLLADWRMFRLSLRGKMQAEVDRILQSPSLESKRSKSRTT